MSAGDTRALIQEAVDRFGREVPALRQLKVVVKLELPARGADANVWRVELPGPKISRDPAADARVEISVPRSHFNELGRDGSLRDWADAYRRGHVTVSGEGAVVKLVGNVIERQLARSGGRV
jgi:hypothetical protein